jgi:hypothetical protein
MPIHWLWMIWANGCELWRVMVDQWLWVMVCNAEPVVLNHGVLCWASGCEFMCAILNRTVVNYVVLYWADCVLVMVCHAGHWLWMIWANGCELWRVMVDQWLWIMVCNVEQVVVSHGELCWTSGCESWCVMLSQWLWIMVCYAEPVVVNHGVLCWASGCESWCAMLSQWLWIMVSYDEQVVVNPVCYAG